MLNHTDPQGGCHLNTLFNNRDAGKADSFRPVGQDRNASTKRATELKVDWLHLHSKSLQASSRSFGNFVPGQELRTVNGPLPLDGIQLHLAAMWAFHVRLFVFEHLDHVCLKTPIDCCCATTLLLEYILGPQFLGQDCACQTIPLPKCCGLTSLLTCLGSKCHARLPCHIKGNVIQRCCPVILRDAMCFALPTSAFWRGRTIRKVHMKLARTNSGHLIS